MNTTTSLKHGAGDAFGTKHIGKIYGVLYCAKGIGALFVPIGNLMMEATGTWSTVLYTVAALDLFAAFLAITVLRPTLAAHVAGTSAPQHPPQPDADPAMPVLSPAGRAAG